jgi:rubrerythrin
VEHVKYTKQCTEIWKRQRRILTIEEPPACSASDSDSSDDDMMEDMMKDVEDELERAPGASGAALGNARGLFKKGGSGRAAHVLDEGGVDNLDEARELRKLKKDMQEQEMEFEEEDDDDEEKVKKVTKKGKKGSDLSAIAESGADSDAGGSDAGGPKGKNNTLLERLNYGMPLMPGQSRQILKRTETKINDNGNGTTTVTFILDPGQIQDYMKKKEEKDNPDMKRGRKRGRRGKEEIDERFMTVDQRKKKLKNEFEASKKALERGQAYMKFLESDSGKAFVMSDKAGYDDEGKKIMKCKACGLAGHMRTNSNCPMYKNTKRVAGGGGGGGRGPELNRDVVRVDSLKLKIRKDAIKSTDLNPTDLKLNFGQIKKRKEREQNKKRKQREQEEREEGDLYKKRPPLAGATRMKKTKRLPLVQFNVLLESIFYEMWNDEENSLMFQQPVDPLLVRDYQDHVSKPISLKCILDKIQSFTYLTTNQFTDDVKLMVDNCRKYNGPQHVLSSKATELLHVVEDELRKEAVTKRLREFEHLASLPILG